MYTQNKVPEAESESDWDSQSEATSPTPRNVKNQPPHIESINEEDTSFNNNSLHLNGFKQSQQSSSSNILGANKISTPKQTPTSRKQGTSGNKSPGVTHFTDTRTYSSSEDDDSGGNNTIIRRKSDKARSAPSIDDPPFDFKGALKETKETKPLTPSGKSRKGNIYDAPQNGTNDIQNWNDSDSEQKTLAELRAGFLKGRQQEAKSTPPTRPQEKPRQQEHNTIQNKDPTHARPSRSIKTPIRTENLQTIQDSSQKNEHDVNKSGEFDQSKKHFIPPELTKSEFVSLSMDVESSTDYHTKPKKGTRKEKKFIYYFEPGQKDFLESSEGHGHAVMPRAADKAQQFIKRGWQEFFGLLQILVCFFLVFLVELVTFILRHIVQGTLLRIIVAIGDHLVKPLLTVLFNGFMQPLLIFVWNVLIGVRNAFQPVAELLVGFAKPMVLILQAFRLVEINWKNTHMLPREDTQIV